MTDRDPPLLPWSALPEGVPVEAEAVVDGASESLVVVRREGAARAWLNICPHAGRRLDWAPGRFLVSRDGHLVCAAHGASFDLGSGECVSGPCRGESLRAVPLRDDEDGVRLA